MALPSQTGRSGMARRYTTSRRRRQRARWRWLLLLILAAAGGYWLWSRQGASEDGAAALADNGSADPTVTDQRGKPVLSDPVFSAPPRQPPPQPRTQTPPPPPAGTLTLGPPGTTEAPTPSPPPAPIRRPDPLPAPARVQPKPERTPPPSTEIVPTGALAHGVNLIQQGQLVEGRAALNSVLLDSSRSLSARQSQTIREALASVNQTLVFSPKTAPGDRLSQSYTINAGDLLVRVAPRFNITYQLIEQINQINARRIRIGQSIKVINGPFHATVVKHAYRMDIYLADPDGTMFYVRSFVVGLGQDDSTPVGQWMVKRGGKLKNPGWTHPRTSKYYAPDDPQNPIGEYWVALEGAEEQTRGLFGYGIHGTIDPSSVGRSASMGCVRMYSDDVAQVFNLLIGGQSRVTILP